MSIRDWLAADPITDGLLRYQGMLRVFLNEIPQDLPPVKDGHPAVVYTLISGTPNNYLAGPPSMEYERWQLDVYANTDQLSAQVFGAVRTVLERHGYTFTNFTDRDPNTRNWRISFDLTVWQPRQ